MAKRRVKPATVTAFINSKISLLRKEGVAQSTAVARAFSAARKKFGAAAVGSAPTKANVRRRSAKKKAEKKSAKKRTKRKVSKKKSTRAKVTRKNAGRKKANPKGKKRDAFIVDVKNRVAPFTEQTWQVIVDVGSNAAQKAALKERAYVSSFTTIVKFEPWFKKRVAFWVKTQGEDSALRLVVERMRELGFTISETSRIQSNRRHKTKRKGASKASMARKRSAAKRGRKKANPRAAGYSRSKKTWKSVRAAWEDIGKKTGLKPSDVTSAHTATSWVWKRKGVKRTKANPTKKVRLAV